MNPPSPLLTAGAYRVAPMQLGDVPAVMDIERLSFTEPWPAEAYRQEVTGNPHACYCVVRVAGAPPPKPAPPRPRPAWMRWLHRSEATWDAEPAPAAAPPQAPLVGYAGLWLLVDEAHISTIAVHPEYRGRGLGELLLVALLGRALELHAAIATLEVRVSNTVALQLYFKHEFEIVGRRKRYYRDNGEDAHIMTVRALDQDYRGRYEQRKAALLQRLAG